MIKYRVNFSDGFTEFLDLTEAGAFSEKVNGEIEKIQLNIVETPIQIFKCKETRFLTLEDAEAESARILAQEGLDCKVIALDETSLVESETIKPLTKIEKDTLDSKVKTNEALL